MVGRPAHVNPYEFVVVASLRAHQLMAGCVPRLEGEHRATTMAQMEVVAGKVSSALRGDAAPGITAQGAVAPVGDVVLGAALA